MKAVDAFMSQRDVLIVLLQHSVVTIASKLYSKSIISKDALAHAMNQVQIARDKTVSLLSVVENKIRAEPHVFVEFIQILESEPILQSQANALVENYHQGMRTII